MSTFNAFKNQKLRYLDKSINKTVNTDEITQGISQDESFLFFRNGENIKIFDRIYDHNGGRLSVKGERASCPLHGWELDLCSQMYTNVRYEKKPILEINKYELDAPYVDIPLRKESLVTHNFDSKKKTTVRFINHACLHFLIDEDFTFATDPWIIGSAFSNGWWLAKESPGDVFKVLNDCNFIYISHNHPDHLHPNSLRHIRKDMPILTAGFSTNSTSVLLEDLGFTDILSMDFTSSLVDECRQFSVSVLKSGDFRDDSGLLIENGEFKCLLTVDSNFINFGKLSSVDLLCSSFAGGASGFPLCFSNYSEEEKRDIVTRNRGSIRAQNIKNIQVSSPHYFMPYAGFFTENSERDQYIKDHNIKNSVEDYYQICNTNQCDLLNVNEYQIFRFEGSNLKDSQVDSTDRLIDTELIKYMNNSTNISTKELSSCIIDYFEGTSFGDNLVVDLIATDDNFYSFFERFKIDFRKREFVRIDAMIDSDELETSALANENRFLQIKVRRDELVNVVVNRKPWEDLSIGFQCRIYRQPNVYNSGFWSYFTNEYIGSNVA